MPRDTTSSSILGGRTERSLKVVSLGDSVPKPLGFIALAPEWLVDITVFHRLNEGAWPVVTPEQFLWPDFKCPRMAGSQVSTEDDTMLCYESVTP
jgi:hypothetical protein